MKPFDNELDEHLVDFISVHEWETKKVNGIVIERSSPFVLASVSSTQC